jgi:hypothetical protein
MASAAHVRKLAIGILALWALASCAVALHSHHGCCGHGHEHEDEAPPSCSICEAVSHVPAITFTRPQTAELKLDVVAWISPWIALVPEDVFFDRPLARGPPICS